MGGGLVQPREVGQVELGVVWRDPPLEHDTAWQVTVSP